jgi:hypothetical protein
MDKPSSNKFSPKGKVKQLTASILSPENAGLRFILNLVGQSGKFESKLGLVLAKRWGKVREDYKSWYAGQQNFKLGCVNTTPVASDTWVVHLLCEDKEGKASDASLDASMKKLGALAKYEHASVHISSVLTGEHPSIVGLATKYLTNDGINVYYYADASAGDDTKP